MILLERYGELGYYWVLPKPFSCAEQFLTWFFAANHENEDWINGEKTEDVVAFLDRLYTAKRKVEERIVVLGGGDSPVCFDTLCRCFKTELCSRESQHLQRLIRS